MSASPTLSESPSPSTEASVTLSTTDSRSNAVTVSSPGTPTETSWFSPSVSPSNPPICAAGWSYYSDSDGSEGQASCLTVTGQTVLSWLTAMTACPMNSHLLTMAGASVNSGLFAFSRTVSEEYFWVGVSQPDVTTSVNRNWTWLDGTSATINLNCDAVNGSSACGLWREFSPEYVDPARTSFAWCVFCFRDVLMPCVLQ